MLLIFELRVRRYEEANPRRLLPVNICGRWLRERRHVSQGGWWSFFLLPLITQGRNCKTVVVVAVVDLLVVVRRRLLGSGARELCLL